MWYYQKGYTFFTNGFNWNMWSEYIQFDCEIGKYSNFTTPFKTKNDLGRYSFYFSVLLYWWLCTHTQKISNILGKYLLWLATLSKFKNSIPPSPPFSGNLKYNNVAVILLIFAIKKTWFPSSFGANPCFAVGFYCPLILRHLACNTPVCRVDVGTFGLR